MLPPEAKTYFDSLLSAASADAWRELAKKQDEFERDEFSRGQGPNGGGFRARLADLYRECLSSQARAIADALQRVHQSFDCPLDEAVDAQIRDWGAGAIATVYQSLEGAYTRYLQRYGVQASQAVGLDQTYALARATVANLPSRYLWELRNVPSKRPQRQAASIPVQVTINNSGMIGAIQTGDGSSANVSQQWVSGDLSELRAAVAALRQAVDRSPDIDPELRLELTRDADKAVAELQQERPNKGRLLRWLGGIGAVVGAIGSVQPAYEALRAVARAVGIPL